MLNKHINSRLREVLEWCNCNKMSLNPRKSKCLIVSNKMVVKCPQLIIGTNPIKEVDSFKYLGNHVDTQLKFNVQTNHLKDKLSQLCGALFRLSKFLDFQSAKNMYSFCSLSIILLHRSMGWCLSVHTSLWWSK